MLDSPSPKWTAFVIALGTGGGMAAGALIGLFIGGIVFGAADKTCAGVCFGVGVSAGVPIFGFIGLAITSTVFCCVYKHKMKSKNT